MPKKTKKVAVKASAAVPAVTPTPVVNAEQTPAAPKAVRVTFSVRAEVGSKVFLAGSFNNWDPAAKELVDKKGTGDFSATLSLAPGDYQYKFVINGTWSADPASVDWVQNDLGTLNSVKHVL